MANAWVLSALWVGLALIATLLAIWFRVATRCLRSSSAPSHSSSSAHFSAPAACWAARNGSPTWPEPEPSSSLFWPAPNWSRRSSKPNGARRCWWAWPASRAISGLHAGRALCSRLEHVRSSWLCGVALSTTSVAVVYAVMLELGFNVTEYGKSILAACFVNDLGTVIALGLIFSPFTMKTLIFVGVCAVLFVLPALCHPWFFKKYGGRVSELETKYILFSSFHWAGWRCGRAVRLCFRPT
jgi:glutathione-regulated potassium-efflux system ancillary protein KefC